MKRLMFVVLLLSSAVAYSQQNRYILIQAGPQQPFYVRMGDRSFSSSAFGHLVIPKLSDSTYILYVGFPRNQVPEQEFSISLNGKDRGFDLKVENTNHLVLFDWQKAELIKSRNPPVPAQEVSYTIQRRTDSYAVLMAGVVNDSLVLVSIQKPDQPEAVSSVSKASTDTTLSPESSEPASTVAIAADNTTSSRIETEKPEPILKDTLAIDQKPAETVPSSTVVDNSNKMPNPVTIRLYSERTGPEEKKLIFIDGAGSKADTIDVTIAKDFEIQADSTPVAGLVKEPLYRPKELSKSVKDSATSSIVLMNSDCTRVASELDVDKLRVLLLKEKEDDDRTFVAKKVFRTRCFTTKQVLALTELFSSEASKYMFLDAAYPFVSDSGNFKSLISLFSDPYYINRFKALVRM